ncbi:hypothetical protein [Burkholderia multivorans]|uniref:hypothetical protein n=1 Tax=Burkholderia multivorans TaxID=87883 RepID=UPI0011B25D0E|nr:hypothetical protein [Burkholderia multivorans]
MAGPWEKYAQDTAASTTGPWDKYSSSAPAAAAPRGPVAPLDRLPPDGPTPAPASKHADTIAERLLGLGKSAVGLGEAGLSAATGALAAPVGAAYGIGKTLTSGKYGTQQGIEEGDRAGAALASKLTYQPRTEAGRNDIDALGNSGLMHALQGMPVESPMIARIPEVPRGVLATGEGVAGTARAGANAVGRGAARAAASALPEVDPQTLQLAREAHQMGFRLTPDMVYGNKYARGAGELAQDNPFVGKTVRDHNQQVFNSHLVNAIGGEGEKLTRKTFSEAMDRSGNAIGVIAEKYPLPIDQSFITKLRENGANQLPEVRGVVNRYAQMIDEAAGKPATLVGGGRTATPREMPGPVFRRINTALSKQIRETANGDLRSALRGLQDDLLEERAKYMSQSDLDAYNEARRQYAIGSTLEPLVAKSSTGDISPAALLGVVTKNAAGKSAMARGTAGQMGLLADIGQRFLKERPSSGTAERSLLQNLMTHPVGSLAAGGTAALTAPAAAAYNRFGPEVTDLLIQRPPAP